MCPLCCRAFQTPQSAAKHVFHNHENFKTTDEEKKKFKYETLLKKEVYVPVTNLSRILTDEVTQSEIMEAAREIVGRRLDVLASSQNKLINLEQKSKAKLSRF